MSNGWSVGCKIVAWVILVVGILTGIIISIKFEIWWPVLSITPGALLTFLLFGTLGYIADNLGGSSYSPGRTPEWLARYDQNNPQYGNKPSASKSATPYIATELSDGQWRCTCGRLNQKYISTCVCGVNKRDVIGPSAKATTTAAEEQNKMR